MSGVTFELLFDHIIYEESDIFVEDVGASLRFISFCSAIVKFKGIMISPINNSYEQASNIVWSYLRHCILGLDATQYPRAFHTYS